MALVGTLHSLRSFRRRLPWALATIQNTINVRAQIINFQAKNLLTYLITLNHTQTTIMMNTIERTTLIAWIQKAINIGNKNNTSLAADIFCTFLETIITNGWRGACHDMSAAFYMVLSEYEIPAQLCIGVISSKIGGDKFDHSWVEINNGIYDITIAYPLLGGAIVSGPVFDSVDLSTNKKPPVIFGAKLPMGEPAGKISDLTLSEYSDLIQTEENKTLWEWAEIIGSAIPEANKNRKQLNSDALQNKYGKIKRVLR